MSDRNGLEAKAIAAHERVRPASMWIGVAAVMAAFGCTQTADDGSSPPSPPPKTRDAAGAGAAASAGTGAPLAPRAGASANSAGTSGSGGSAPPTAGSAPPTQAPALPAEVCGVLRENGCVTCHQRQLQGGAQMSLQWRSDFAGPAKDGMAIARKVLERIVDTAKPMPPATTMRPMMSAEQVAVLQRWIDGGMPGTAGGACEEGAIQEPTAPAWATQPWPQEECEYLLTVAAHGAVGTPLVDDPSAYEPPEAKTYYHCFYEKVPWGDKPVQALATRVRLVTEDDQAIVHHLVTSALGPNDGMSILGGERPSQGGDQHECPNPSGSTLGVWAPGAQNPVTLPDDVGVLLPSGADAYIELQIHYNNAHAGMQSRVAFDICATSKLRPNTAGVHWLGYENAVAAVPLAALGPELQPQLDNKGNGVAVGSCSVKERARVLWMAPHMHELGRFAKAELVRPDGTLQTLHEGAFDFSEQTAYFQDNVWVEPGSSIRTTCTWDTSRKIVFGFASDEEMCFIYTLAYPVGALSGAGLEKGVVGGELNCAGSE